MTLREVFLAYQSAIESRWNYQSAVLSELRNISLMMLRVNSKSRPPLTTPKDFDPLRKSASQGAEYRAENIRDLMAIGDTIVNQRR